MRPLVIRSTAVLLQAIPFVLGTSIIAGSSGYSTAPFAAAESLCYAVKWGPFRLGTLTVVQEDAMPGDSSRTLIRMRGDTSPHIPFLDLHFVNRSILRPGYPTVRDFRFESGSIGEQGITYRWEREFGSVAVVIYRQRRPVDSVRVVSDRPVYDAGGLFMLLRGFSGSSREISVATTVDREIHETRFRCTDERREIKVGAFPEKMPVVRVEGEALWEMASCAGLTGEFEAWLSDDEVAVPLKASFRIALGSIVLELESIERTDHRSPGSPAGLADPSGVAESVHPEEARS